MGYIVKTREALFSIDLNHRRGTELAPLLDFALITHNHDDHWRQDFYRAMDGAGKTVVSNFLDNYGVRNWKKDGGYTRAVKTFKIKDVEIRTSLIDHNDYLIDFTTAFEIRVGDFILYHTGDSGRGTEPKLGTVWGKPDLWLFFPGCGIDVSKAVPVVQPKRIVFGHIWELGHKVVPGTAIPYPFLERLGSFVMRLVVIGLFAHCIPLSGLFVLRPEGGLCLWNPCERCCLCVPRCTHTISK